MNPKSTYPRRQPRPLRLPNLTFSWAILIGAVMLLTLGLAESRRLLWGGVSSGVQVVRATSTQAEVIAESKSCSGDWREPVALSLGEGWRALPSDAVRLSWDAQPNESMVVAVTQQRGHVGRCWAESYMIGRKWLPESITGPGPVEPPVEPPVVIVPGEPCTDCGVPQPFATISASASGPAECGTNFSGLSAFSSFDPATCTWAFFTQDGEFAVDSSRQIAIHRNADGTYDARAIINPGGGCGDVGYFSTNLPAEAFRCDKTSGVLSGTAILAVDPFSPTFFTSGPATVVLGGG